MKKFKFAASVAAATFLVAGIAFAQVVGTNGVGITSNPVTGVVTPGSNVALGTFNVTGDAQGAGLTSVPFTLTAGGGATAADLSNCQVFNASGAAVSAAFTPVAGTNMVNLNSGVMAGGTAGATQTFTVRCTVANGVSSSATYQFIAGTPILSNALSVNVITPTTVEQGGINNVLALITLDATHSGGNVSLGNVPVTITSNGASTSQLSNCQLRSINNLTGTLNTTAAVQNGTTMSFSLANQLTVPAGTVMTVVLTCNVDPATPVGGSFSVSVAPLSIGATAQNGGAVITPGASVASNGSALPTTGVVTVVSSGAVTPGLPNTGEGGNAQETLVVLALSALLAIGAGLYVRRAYR